ncbi:MAG: phosphatidate cytidylyltransferase [Candidatus Howiella sp.]|jgi:phosphatidate cytidylyltransferase
MKKRLITAAVGLSLLAVLLFFRDTLVFDVAVILINVIALYEILYVTKYVKYLPLVGISAVYTVIAPFIYMGYIPVDINSLNVVYVMILFIATLIKHEVVQPQEVAFTFTMSMLLSYAFSCFSLVSHSENGLFFLMFALNCAWVSDAGAYFVGSAFGKHKLAPKISPHKTIEGAVGGVLSSMLVTVLLALIYPRIFNPGWAASMPRLVLFTALLSVVGMIGDLTASYLKRSAGLKDFGNIMPGHGGILDRFDSLLVIMPLVYVTLGFNH